MWLSRFIPGQPRPTRFLAASGFSLYWVSSSLDKSLLSIGPYCFSRLISVFSDMVSLSYCHTALFILLVNKVQKSFSTSVIRHRKNGPYKKLGSNLWKIMSQLPFTPSRLISRCTIRWANPCSSLRPVRRFISTWATRWC